MSLTYIIYTQWCKFMSKNLNFAGEISRRGRGANSRRRRNKKARDFTDFLTQKSSPLSTRASYVQPFSAPAPYSPPLSGVIPPSMKGKKVEHFFDKISSTGCKWSSLNAPSTATPVSHPLLEESKFPFFSPYSFPSSSLWGNKELDLPV